MTPPPGGEGLPLGRAMDAHHRWMDAILGLGKPRREERGSTHRQPEKGEHDERFID